MSRCARTKLELTMTVVNTIILVFDFLTEVGFFCMIGTDRIMSHQYITYHWTFSLQHLFGNNIFPKRVLYSIKIGVHAQKSCKSTMLPFVRFPQTYWVFSVKDTDLPTSAMNCLSMVQ